MDAETSVNRQRVVLIMGTSYEQNRWRSSCHAVLECVSTAYCLRILQDNYVI